MQRIKRASVLVATGLLLLGAFTALAPRAEGFPWYLDALEVRYPSTTLAARIETATGSRCNVCHTPAGDSGNCYRIDLTMRLHAGETIEDALANLDGLDSDGDGTPNGAEITADRGDGHVGYNPGLVGPTGTDPCGTDPNVPITGELETPPSAGCAADRDGSGGVNVFDLLDYLADWFVQDPSAELTGDAPASIDVFDLLAFLDLWFVDIQDPSCEG